jgi:hypothetical protein
MSGPTHAATPTPRGSGEEDGSGSGAKHKAAAGTKTFLVARVAKPAAVTGCDQKTRGPFTWREQRDAAGGKARINPKKCCRTRLANVVPITCGPNKKREDEEAERGSARAICTGAGTNLE